MTPALDAALSLQISSSLGGTGRRPMQVALVHDWLTGMRGGEKVLELLCERFPTAPLWTLLHVPGTVSRTISTRRIHTSLLQKMPLAKDRYRNYLPLFPLFAELHKAHGADLIISTSHAVAKSMVRRQRARPTFHICYIHTPMRYAWDLFDDYFGPKQVGQLASYLLFRPLVNLLRMYDAMTSRRVDLFLANSHYVAERVTRLYGRDAQVLPPPVDTDRFLAVKRQPGDEYLVVSALVPYKRIDHAIRACSSLGRRLRIVGKGPELASLKELAVQLGAKVEFTGFVADDELAGIYGRARALLFPGVEDFGIVPVEAIACGCPVIALGVGGVLDSMTAETAVMYTQPTANALAQAILEYEKREGSFDTRVLRQRAQCFSKSRFFSALESTLLQVRDRLATLHSPTPESVDTAAVQSAANSNRC